MRAAGLFNAELDVLKADRVTFVGDAKFVV